MGFFNGTEMLEDCRVLGLYRNSSFYFLSRFKNVIFILFQNKIEVKFYNLHTYFHVCWIVPAHFQHVKYFFWSEMCWGGVGISIPHLSKRKLGVVETEMQ